MHLLGRPPALDDVVDAVNKHIFLLGWLLSIFCLAYHRLRRSHHYSLIDHRTRLNWVCTPQTDIRKCCRSNKLLMICKILRPTALAKCTLTVQALKGHILPMITVVISPSIMSAFCDGIFTSSTGQIVQPYLTRYYLGIRPKLLISSSEKN